MGDWKQKDGTREVTMMEEENMMNGNAKRIVKSMVMVVVVGICWMGSRDRQRNEHQPVGHKERRSGKFINQSAEYMP